MRTPILLAVFSLSLPACVVSRAPFELPTDDAPRSGDASDGSALRDAAQLRAEGLAVPDASDGGGRDADAATDRPGVAVAPLDGPSPDGGADVAVGPASDATLGLDVGLAPVDTPSSCGPLEGLCEGACVALLLDPSHCGACGRACPSAEHAVGTCNGGRCELACAAGYGDCGRGCQDLQGDGMNCGACGHACPFAPHALPLCQEGRCGLDCGATGYTDCDGDPANGCEAALASDLLNCGGCGRRCGEGQSCIRSVCRG